MYNILTTYLLAWILFVACLAYGFEVATTAVAGWLGFGRPEVLWTYVGSSIGIDPLYLRLAFYPPLHVLVLFLARGPLDWLQSVGEGTFDAVVDAFRAFADRRPKLAVAGRSVYTVAVTLVLVPFLLQPTLVRGFTSTRAWLERTANLADGTASAFVVDSVVGAYRRFVVDDVESAGGVDDADIPSAGDDGVREAPEPTGEQPMMDRWDPAIEEICGGDADTAARLKAFMWVESGGRQFAVSHTGCAGLMQFCAGTARRQPFREVFGTGSVYTCGCHPDCSTPKKVSEALETGRRERIDNLGSKFPCNLKDARFDGRKSLRAGRRYIDQLAEDFGGNLFLMYIGYNSGPAVAERVWERLDEDPSAELDEIEPHLAEAMRPHFPDSADTRAESLLDTHLPKLRRAFERYHPEK